jgi:transposase
MSQWADRRIYPFMSRPFGTGPELERRRRRAVDAVHQGESPETVARVFGVARGSVYRWLASARQPDGLAARPNLGPAPRLSPDQLHHLDDLLRAGAQTHGWPNRLWTCARVAEVIRRHFGVTLHHDHVGRMLRTRLNWSPQKPRRHARERDEAAIEDWKTRRFPRIAAAARRRDAHLVFLDESGFMLTPTVRRTWAPRGSKPVLDSWDRRDRLSAISGLTVSPRAGRLNLVFDLLSDNANVRGEDVVAFLRQLKRHVGGGFTVVWDGSPVHSRSAVVRRYLARHPDIVAETLPAYAPELNPDELVWGWSKYGRLPNLAAEDTGWLRDHVIEELTHLQENPHLLQSFLGHADLPIAA